MSLSVDKPPISSAPHSAAPAQTVPRTVARWEQAVLAGYSLAFLSKLFWIISVREFWYDEIFTITVARTGSLAAVWRALAAGADNHPPLSYWLVHLSESIFGQSEFAARLPAAVCFWAMTLCVFLFVRRRTSPSCAFAAMLFPLISSAYFFAYEARGYSPLLFCSALAVLSWQSLKWGRNSWLWSAGLTFGIAGAVYSHYYGILVLLPVAAGELVWVLRGRKVDWRVPASVAAAGVLCLGLVPIASASSKFSSGFWSEVSLVALKSVYEQLFSSTLFPACILIVVLALCRAMWHRQPDVAQESVVPAEEWAVAAAFLAIPLASYGLALFTHALLFRYVLPAIVGAGILLGFTLSETGRRRSWPGVMTCVVLGAYFLLRLAQPGFYDNQRTAEGLRLIRQLSALSAEPIVSGNFEYLAAYHYEPSLRRRLHLVSGGLAPTTHRALTNLRNLLPGIQITNAEDLLAANTSFLIVAPAQSALHKLVESKHQMILLPAYEQPVYRVSAKSGK